MKKIILTSILLITLSACSGQTFVYHKDHYKIADPIYSHKDGFIFGGLAQTKVMRNPSRFCEDGELAKIVFKDKVSDVLLSIFTLGIYTPRTVEVYCVG